MVVSVLRRGEAGLIRIGAVRADGIAVVRRVVILQKRVGGPVAGVDVRLAVNERDRSGHARIPGVFDRAGNAAHDDAVALVVIARHAVDQIIERIPRGIRGGGMAVRREEHEVLLREHAVPVRAQLRQHAGLDALRHVHELRRDERHRRFPVVHDEGAGIKPREQPLHHVAEGVVAGADLRDRAGDIRARYADAHTAVRGKGSRRNGAEQHDRQHQRENGFSDQAQSKHPRNLFYFLLYHSFRKRKERNSNI